MTVAFLLLEPGVATTMRFVVRPNDLENESKHGANSIGSQGQYRGMDSFTRLQFLIALNWLHFLILETKSYYL